MAVHTGKAARQTGGFRRKRCHQQTHVTAGRKIPKCGKRGNETSTRTIISPETRATEGEEATGPPGGHSASLDLIPAGASAHA